MRAADEPGFQPTPARSSSSASPGTSSRIFTSSTSRISAMVVDGVVEKVLQVALGQRAFAEPRHGLLLACAQPQFPVQAHAVGDVAAGAEHAHGLAVLHDHRGERLDPACLTVRARLAGGTACERARRCASPHRGRHGPAPGRADAGRSRTTQTCRRSCPPACRGCFDIARPGEAIGCDVPRPDADPGILSALSTRPVSGKNGCASLRIVSAAAECPLVLEGPRSAMVIGATRSIRFRS